MTGHVRRRGAASWELKFDVGADPVTGKRRIRYASFKGTKKAAEIELARLVSEHAAGTGVDPSRITVAEFVDNWDKNWASSNVEGKTLERYRQILRLTVVPHLGNVRIQKLRPVHLVDLYAKLLREGGRKGAPLSPRSVGHTHRVLHRMFGHAATWGVMATNIASVVEPPPVPDEEITILSEQQIAATLKKIEGRTLRPIVLFLLGTGCRRGEALAVRWRDLDLDKGAVSIERSIEQTKAGLRFKSPKTRNGRRRISIAPSLVAELRAHRLRQQERRLALGLGRAADDDLVFARWDGGPRAPHWLTQKFALVMAGLQIEATLHGLRHTHVSQLIAGGMDIVAVSRRIGHANAAITLRVYGHMFGSSDGRAAEIMETTFAKVKQ